MSGVPVPGGALPDGALPDGALEVVPVELYLRPVLEVARDLLGRLLVRDAPQGRSAVRLVEVEAYDGSGMDPASHAFRGRTRRNAVMFGPPGRLYVYFIYGMHFGANVVCAPEGVAQAVLLRAGEPVLGVDLMQARRPASSRRDLARGPGRLTEALGLGAWANGADLAAGPVLLTEGWPVADAEVAWTGRVGVSAGADRPWRALVAGNRYVSPGRPGPPPRRRATPGPGRPGPSTGPPDPSTGPGPSTGPPDPSGGPGPSNLA